jgi:plasmid maintenance system killer protein
MIVSYRDKRTRDFAAGKWVKALSGIERSARLKLDHLETATALKDLAALAGNPFEGSRATAKANTASASTINGGFASSGRNDHRGCRTLKLSITTKENVVAVTAIHPGEHLAEELKELDMSAAELARKIGVPKNRFTGIRKREIPA